MDLVREGRERRNFLLKWQKRVGKNLQKTIFIFLLGGLVFFFSIKFIKSFFLAEIDHFNNKNKKIREIQFTEGGEKKQKKKSEKKREKRALSSI